MKINDITDEKLELLSKITPSPKLLTEIVDLSRSHFGWYTKQFTRGIEYPWVAQKVFEMLGTSLKGVKLLDVGAGVSPLPLLFAKYGAEVVTIDYSKQIRDIKDREKWTEWGFLDYSILDKNITSLNENIFKLSFEKKAFDLIYSVSVIEHMPKKFRLSFFEKSKSLISKDGHLILTLDVVPYTNNLWNVDRGKVVEDVAQHGDLSTIEVELSSESFKIDKIEAYRNLEKKYPDLFLLHAIQTSDESYDQVEHSRKIALKKPHYAGSYFNWGVDLLKTKRFLEAQGVIHKAVEMNPVFCDSSFVFNTLREQLELAFETCKDWAWPAVQLGSGFLRQNQLDKAEAYLRNVVECRSVFDQYTYARGFEYLCQTIFKRHGSNSNTASLIEDICLKDIEKHGKQAWSSLYLGAAFKVQGKLDEAYQHFEKATNSDLVSSFTHASRGCSSVKDYQILNDELTLKTVEKNQNSWLSEYLSDIVFDEESKQMKESSILLLNCCDHEYFSMFAENLAYSCFKQNSDVSLHFHVVNPEQSTFELWNFLKKCLPIQKISLSHESIKIKNLKAYYAIVRFLRVVELMERYDKNIVMIDSDSVVRGDLSLFSQVTNKFDICLNIKQDDNYFPWRSIVANLVFAEANPKSKIFLTAISKYLETVFQPNLEQDFWWTDQNALFAAYTWCQKFEPSIRIGSIYDYGLHNMFAFAPNSDSKKESFVRYYRERYSNTI